MPTQSTVVTTAPNPKKQPKKARQSNQVPKRKPAKPLNAQQPPKPQQGAKQNEPPGQSKTGDVTGRELGRELQAVERKRRRVEALTWMLNEGPAATRTPHDDVPRAPGKMAVRRVRVLPRIGEALGALASNAPVPDDTS